MSTTTASTARKSTADWTAEGNKEDQRKQTVTRPPDGGRGTGGEDIATGGVVVRPDIKVETVPNGGVDRGDPHTDPRKETSLPGYNYNSGM